jgi:hypothetical protein
MAKKSQVDNFALCRDHNSRTCLKVDEQDGMIIFIPLEITGFTVHRTSVESFWRRYEYLVDYPINRACELYANYCRNLGAEKKALDYLAMVIDIPEELYELATARQGTVGEELTSSPNSTKRVKRSKGNSKGSAAARFRELIMEGKLTDDEIFTVVQGEFGLDSNRRSYVQWYRKELVKKGQNPPEAK